MSGPPKGESVKAKRAWADYLAMGPSRSMERLAIRYRATSEPVPTRLLSTLGVWSRTYGWQARLKQIADDEAKAAEEREAAYRREVMESGYAVAHVRVESLKRLAVRLLAQLEAEGVDSRLWVRDVKSLGKYGTEEIERFNAAEVEQFRGLLEDIAREKGERHDKSDVNLSGGVTVNWVPWVGKRKENDGKPGS